MGRTTVRGRTAQVLSRLMMRGDRCLQWDDPVTAVTTVYSLGTGGAIPMPAKDLERIADSLARP